MLQDFKNFLLKGNAIDLAIGFMFGAAFATVVRSFVDNIIMPPIWLLLWKVDFSNLFIALDWNSYTSLAALEEAGAPAIKYGQFITDSISFTILGFIIFMMVRVLANMKKKEEAKPVEEAVIPQDIVLLTEIRDSLMKK